MTLHLHRWKVVGSAALVAALVSLCQALSGQTDLFISEYVESTNNKCIEIFNPTGSDISLNGIYRLRIRYQTGSFATLSNLSGTISAKSSFVVCTSGSSFSPDQSMGVAGFNGDDAIILEKNMTQIDIFGNLTCAPTVPVWSEGGVTAEDVTLVRKPCIQVGITSGGSGCSFPSLSSEWIEYSVNDLSHLGSHDYLYGTPTITQTGVSDCGGSDGTIAISADGFGLEYSIDGGSSFLPGSTFTGLPANDYPVVVRVASDHTCTYAQTVTVSERTLPVITDEGEIDPTDCGIDNGEIHLTATGSSLEYSIDNGNSFVSSPDFSGLAAGIYEIKVRLSGTSNCLDMSTVTLTAPTPPNILSVTPTGTSDCGLADGMISIAANGGSLQYSIDNGLSWANESNFMMLAAGAYDIMVRKSASLSCVDNTTTTIVSPDLPILSILDISPTSCKGTATGSITVSASGGSGSYSYLWDGPTHIGNVASASNLSAGNYQVTVSDNDSPGCQDVSLTIVVTQPSSDPPAVALDPLPSFCELDADYPLPLEQNGFSGQWTGDGVSNNSFDPSGLAGSVVLTFTPGPGQCALSNTTQLMVTQAAVPVLNALPMLCSQDVAIDLSTTAAGYDGTWSGPGVTGNQFDPGGLMGIVSLTFNPTAGQCAQASTLEVEVRGPVAPVLQPLTAKCQSTNPITLFTTQNGFSGQWSGPGVRNNILHPDELSGSITLTFQPDPGQCGATVSKEIEIYLPLKPTLDALPDICADASPLSLSTSQDEMIGDWSGPGTKENTFDPAGLNGPVVLTFAPNSNQCGEAAEQQILVIAPAELTFNKKNPLCNGEASGSAEVLITGGKAPYVFDWDIDGQDEFDDAQLLDNLVAGTYVVKVKDQASCVSSAAFTLNDPPSLRISISSTLESNTGAADGSAEITVRGGTPNYSYAWSNGASTPHIDQLAPGPYGVTVTDANGCETTAMTIVNTEGCKITAIPEIKDVTCFGGNDGRVLIQVSHGLSPYTYQWNHDSTLNDSLIVELTAGTYEVLAKDAVGCQTQLSLIVNQPDTLISTFIPKSESITEAGDGMITTLTKGGTAPYSYLWNTGSDSAILTNLKPGQYDLTTTDAAGCTFEGSVTLNGSFCDVTIEVETKDVSCFGASDAQAVVMVTAGQTPLTYNWSHLPTLADTEAQELEAGDYAITVTDEKGCIAVEPFTISQPSAMVLQPTISHSSAKEQQDGVLSIQVSGGVPPYRFAWSTGITDSILTNLYPGIYQVTVTDKTGCTQLGRYEIMEQICELEALVNVDSVRCAGKRQGSAELMISGAQGALKISWSQDNLLHDLRATDLAAGEYQVTVQDAAECSVVVDFAVGEPELLRIAFEAENETVVGGKDGYIAVEVFGGSPPYQYNWNTGQMSDSIGSLKPGTYMITVEDSHGCLAARSTMINPANCSLLSNVGVRAPRCFGGADGRARLDITTLAFPVAISWSHDTLLQSNVAENLMAGDYSVTIVDQDQCRHVWPFAIKEPDPLVYSADVRHQSIPNVADGGIILSPEGGTGPYRVDWLDGATGPEKRDLIPGTYYFTITDANGCSLADSLLIFASDVCLLEIVGNVIPSGCNGSPGSIELAVKGNRGNVNILWSDASLGKLPKVEGLQPGRYEVNITDDICSISETFEIESRASFEVKYSLGEPLCAGDGNVFRISQVIGGKAPYAITLDGEAFGLTDRQRLNPGPHQLSVSDISGCSFSQTFEVREDPQLQGERDTTINRGEEITLVGTLPGPEENYQYRWRTSEGIICEQCQTITTNPESTETYFFEINDGSACSATSTFRVFVNTRSLIYIPNAYTPNGDGINDGFVVYDGLELVEQIESLQIFDRRGLKIYETSNLPSNQEAPNFSAIMSEAIAPQVYMYIIRIRFKQGYDQMIKGDFTILR